MLQAVTDALRNMGFQEVLQASGGMDATRVLKSTAVAAVVAEWTMPGLSGLGLLRWVRS